MLDGVSIAVFDDTGKIVSMIETKAKVNFGIRNFYVADPEGNLLEIGSWEKD